MGLQEQRGRDLLSCGRGPRRNRATRSSSGTVATGRTAGHAPDATAVTALNSNGTLDWQDQLSGYTPASPALADLTGNGQLDVVEPTWTAYGPSNRWLGLRDRTRWSRPVGSRRAVDRRQRSGRAPR